MDFTQFAATTGLAKIKPGQKVAVALSGGLDSRQTLKRLMEYDITLEAFHLLLHKKPGDDSPQKAAQAAADLKTPFHLIDFSSAFEKLVIAPFVQAYQEGRTPNPCVLCNPNIKFGLLLDEILKRGFDFLATGHYAAQSQNGDFLMRAQDSNKDQSYFMSRLSSAQIAKSIWPLALNLKEEVKAEAKGEKFKAPAESQEICFVPDDYRSFLKDRLSPEKPGDFVDAKGKIMGRHLGLSHYTVGQRRGLGVPGPEPYYVVRIDANQNQITLGTKGDMFQSEFYVKNLVLNVPYQKNDSFTALVQLRSRHRAAAAQVNILADEQAHIKFAEPQSAITPGQAAAIYQGSVCLGAGECL